MNFRLVDSGWDQILDEALTADNSSVRIICPFIKDKAARRLLQYGHPKQLEVITLPNNPILQLLAYFYSAPVAWFYSALDQNAPAAGSLPLIPEGGENPVGIAGIRRLCAATRLQKTQCLSPGQAARLLGTPGRADLSAEVMWA